MHFGEKRGERVQAVARRSPVAKHIGRTEVRFEIDFLPSNKASAHAGQLAVLALLKEFGLWRRVREARALDWRLQKTKGFDPEVMVGQLVFCFYGLAGLAYNVLQALKLLHLPASKQPKRVRTLIRHLLLVP